MTPTVSAKLRYSIATRGRTLRYVGATFLILGVIGITLTMLFPPTTTMAEVTDRSVVETETNLTATVVGDHALYDDGERLHNEPVYVRSVTPELTVGAVTSAPPDGVAVTQRIAIVYQATSKDGDVFRERTRPIGATTGTIDRDGETVDTVATLRITELADTLDGMRNEVGDAGVVTAFLRVETSYTGPEYADAIADQAEIELDADSYRVTPLTLSQDHSTTGSVEIPITDEVFQVTVPFVGPVVIPHFVPFFAVFGILGAVLVGAGRYDTATLDADRERVTLHRLRYDDWISVGELPSFLANHPLIVPVTSLEALVDVAIDSDTRVIYDPHQQCYAVLTGVAVFVFISEPDPDSEIGGFTFDNTTGDRAA